MYTLNSKVYRVFKLFNVPYHKRYRLTNRDCITSSPFLKNELHSGHK